MKRRTKRNQSHPFHKYRTLGALAQIRASQIIARYHRVNLSRRLALHHSQPHPLSNEDQPQINASDDFPYCVETIYAPRCPQRKKVIAPKSVLFTIDGPVNSPMNSPDMVVDLSNNDTSVAN
ncbi:uncharacterized protein LOC133294131 [Gastrolobium bilobum]|uniref:uncharacterized protein LOC133294131 n=1 Tax=Gastrolobium bilobum TaxID=150636 RepID=UPI002AB1F458|nr:uncharacterized protein LOC133294131 [Gastrolobium bilobum]